jgi:hypothetical protein
MGTRAPAPTRAGCGCCTGCVGMEWNGWMDGWMDVCVWWGGTGTMAVVFCSSPIHTHTHTHTHIYTHTHTYTHPPKNPTHHTHTQPQTTHPPTQVYRDLSGKTSWAHVRVVWRDLDPASSPPSTVVGTLDGSVAAADDCGGGGGLDGLSGQRAAGGGESAGPSSLSLSLPSCYEGGLSSLSPSVPPLSSTLPSCYEGGVYLVEGVFTRRPRDAGREATSAAQAAKLKRRVSGGSGYEWGGFGVGFWVVGWGVECGVCGVCVLVGGAVCVCM